MISIILDFKRCISDNYSLSTSNVDNIIFWEISRYITVCSLTYTKNNILVEYLNSEDPENVPSIREFFSLDPSKGTFSLKIPLVEYPFTGSSDNRIEVSRSSIEYPFYNAL
jgi:hypothetical protein